MEFLFNCPINNLSFGQVSLMLLREFHLMNLDIAVAPIGAINLEGANLPQDFSVWLNKCLAKTNSRHNRDKHISLKLWHLNGSLESFSKKQVLLTFYEVDKPTVQELNIVAQNEKVIFSSSYAANLFKERGANNVVSVPLAFDRFNFFPTERPSYPDKRITFNLLGKFEKRKRHEFILKSWIKKYGKQDKFFLKAALHNPFIPVEELTNLFISAIGGQSDLFNVKFYPFMDILSYNRFLGDGNIVIACSGGEGWSLADFEAVALGSHAVTLKAHSYLDWANEKNSVLINPSGKIPAADGRFFAENSQFNNGNIYDFNEDDFIEGCEKAIERVKIDPMNWEGCKLQSQFTTRKFAENVLEVVKSV